MLSSAAQRIDTSNIPWFSTTSAFSNITEQLRLVAVKGMSIELLTVDPILRRWLHADFILIIYILEIPSPSSGGSGNPVILFENYVQGVTVQEWNFIT